MCVTHVYDHAHCGKCGRQVLRVRRSDRHWYTAGVQTAVESGNKVDALKEEEEMMSDSQHNYYITRCPKVCAHHHKSF